MFNSFKLIGRPVIVFGHPRRFPPPVVYLVSPATIDRRHGNGRTGAVSVLGFSVAVGTRRPAGSAAGKIGGTDIQEKK